MPKPLVFQYQGSPLAFQMKKVDRAKLYGYVENEVLDEQERRCDLATLAADGHTLIGKGGTAIGNLTPDGLWCDRKQLHPVDLEGQPLEPVPSSFEAPVPLTQKVRPERFLDHSIRAVYVMESEDENQPLLEELRQGAIFEFPYSFRGGLEADAGFLFLGDDDTLFFAVGSPANVEFVGLQQAAGLVHEEDGNEEDEDDGDLMDFGML